MKILGKERNLTHPAPLDDGDSDCISFCVRGIEDIRKSKSGVIVCSNKLEYEPSDYEDRTLILVDNPRLEFIRVLREFFGESPVGIHPSVVIYPNVKIGKNVTIYAGTVIGSPGFGYTENEDREWEHMPQLGGVVIGDDVNIGANCVVACGTMSDTVIGQGTKIDCLTHIAHNVKIGKHCHIVSHTDICGSVIVGDYCWISSHVSIRDHITVGNNAFVGMGAIVIKDVPDNVVVAGCPARKLRDR